MHFCATEKNRLGTVSGYFGIAKAHSVDVGFEGLEQAPSLRVADASCKELTLFCYETTPGRRLNYDNGCDDKLFQQL